ncbi:hydrogenase maturation nickel metallochaperone HypA [Pseudorhodoferax sp. Leaf267]|uniref:hydrogenase maturation nickel metallochaperone HypA/HybF n=1 Tax=Pseudorhodoferax sp. Leaf267 TaxID=1736316 RepID=UPI0006F30420|nr:hydrogenase maturation nickel metallochaperone HypA [Pseudorhodoferax sp. Leaf267]KQP15011.1 hydrogenase nickel incorporation protein HypA [Pseudorhodoferax sp. Leaf267]
MHEASLAGGVLQLVDDTAAREGFARVTLLRLEVGALAGVELRALQFALEAIAPGTRLADARFEFDEPPGQAWCMGCARSTPLARRGDACTHCGDYRVQPTGGAELRVVEMLVED